MKTKRQHRSTLDLCRKYLRKCMLTCEDDGTGGRADYKSDFIVECACEEIGMQMDGDLTFENWKAACDRYFGFV